MFVEHAAEIDVPEPVAAEILANDYKEMEGMGAAAYRKGEELRSRVGPGGLLAKEVVVAIGEPKMSRRGVVIPVRWRATGASRCAARSSSRSSRYRSSWSSPRDSSCARS